MPAAAHAQRTQRSHDPQQAHPRSVRQLLVQAFEETARTTLTASAIKSKMVALESSFDERNYGCRSFRDRFPARQV